MPWDRHKVRNCPVTQALGLLHGTAELQAASPSSGGLAAPWSLGSAQPGASRHVAVPGRARGGPHLVILPKGKGEKQWANKGFCAAPLPLCAWHELSWQRQDGE